MTQELSKNQQKFIRSAKRAGIEVDMTYSGRAMFGRTCPAVRVDRPSDIPTRAHVAIDSMGKGVVVYARD